MHERKWNKIYVIMIVIGVICGIDAVYYASTHHAGSADTFAANAASFDASAAEIATSDGSTNDISESGDVTGTISYSGDANAVGNAARNANATGNTNAVGDANATKAGTICVYVCGAVKKPAVYELLEGARVYEAIAAAGGMTEEADEGYLNQAAVVQDADVVRVYTKEELAEDAETTGDAIAVGYSGNSQATGNTGNMIGVGSPTNGQASANLVNINTADASLLMTIPGIGEKKAADIIRNREEQGRFATISEITRVSGIGDAMFAKMESYICTD